MARTTYNSQEAVTEIRDLARALADKIREVRRAENALYMDCDSPARGSAITNLDQAQANVASTARNLDDALNYL